MKSKNSNAIVTLISFVVVALLLVAVVGVIFKYTNGGNESFKTFYVQYGNEKILSTDTEKKMELERERLYYFEVGYPLDVGTQGDSRDYSVSVVSNTKEDFDFKVDNDTLSWKGDVPELSEYFGLNKQATSFTLFIPKDTSLQTILQGVYAGKTVTVPAAEEIGEYLYTLVISSYNGKITYRINLELAG